ncbi:MFS transporter [uncultured Parasphingorhabdus sp.]|uniref:MFS transporter n=1 Tax=uncultured Parasphingorhabdus sp. TaxID=2709694 RepID=UPI002AA646DF|nr:MFS transporter [uncultured Parasphingorhabdus sp.]
MVDDAYSKVSWLSATFSPLSNSVFRNIWMAGAASNMGAIVQAASAAWLMTTMTSSSVLIASVQTAASLPLVLSAIPAGAAADLYDKRLQMLLGNLVCLVAIIALVVMTLQNELTPASLLVLTAIISLGFSAFLPAWHATVMEIVERRDLAASISLNNLAYNIARAVGPAIGAEIISLFGIAIAFGLNGVTYLIMIGVLISWRHQPPIKLLPPERIGRAMIDGLQFVRLSPGVRLHIIRGFLMTLTASSLLALPPVVAVELGLETRGFGILLASFGGGAMAGALTVAWVRHFLAPQWQLFWAAICVATACFALAFSSTLLTASAALLLGGIGWIQSLSTLQLAIQTSCPRWVLARTISVFSMTFALGIAIGSILWGVVASQAGLISALLISGLGQFAFSVFSSTRHFHSPDESDLEPKIEITDQCMLNIDPRSRPIWLTVEYNVPRSNVASFRQAMREKARIRRRDGARRWSLGQDVDDPNIWIERFQSPSWADYLHGYSRMLVSDISNDKQILSQCEGEPILRRRMEIS